MKLVSFRGNGRTGVGIDTADGIVPLETLVQEAPSDMLGVVAAGAPLLARAAEALSAEGATPLPDTEVEVLAPIPVPARNVICVGKNYYDHANEFQNSGFDASSAGQAIPDVPIFFTKAPTAVIGPQDEIDGGLDPDGTVDYEGELTIVIGKVGRAIAAEDALDHVFGYTIINDVTARATQHRHKQWFLGKSFDTFCPMGPSIVTADEIAELSQMRLETRVNGEIRQSASVADLIFDVPTLIAAASRSMTLQPGDLIATGTPAGVGIGFDPPRYLKSGDTVSVTVEPIGTLTNTVV